MIFEQPCLESECSCTGTGSAQYRVAVLVLSAPKNREKRRQIRKLRLPGCHLQVSHKLWSKLRLRSTASERCPGENMSKQIWFFSVSLSHRANRQLQSGGISPRGFGIKHLWYWKLVHSFEEAISRKLKPTTTSSDSLLKRVTAHYPGKNYQFQIFIILKRKLQLI